MEHTEPHETMDSKTVRQLLNCEKFEPFHPQIYIYCIYIYIHNYNYLCIIIMCIYTTIKKFGVIMFLFKEINTFTLLMTH